MCGTEYERGRIWQLSFNNFCRRSGWLSVDCSDVHGMVSVYERKHGCQSFSVFMCAVYFVSSV